MATFRFRSRLVAGFTLIELLIVVAIIAILAAIAVPNFLEAQVRSKVSRAQADMRSMATAIEAYAVDNNSYPAGTDNPQKYPERIQNFFGPALAAGYYTFMTRDAVNNKIAGRDFATITTPIAYISSLPTDPFSGQAAGFLSYCYRHAGTGKNGWVMTSFGPDTDLFEARGGKVGCGNGDATNPLSTALDPKNPARMGDINEREVIAFIELTGFATGATVTTAPVLFRPSLQGLMYDPTNGTVSDGDLVRVNPGL